MSAVQHSSKETQQQMCTALADPHIFPLFPLKKNREKKKGAHLCWSLAQHVRNACVVVSALCYRCSCFGVCRLCTRQERRPASIEFALERHCFIVHLPARQDA